MRHASSITFALAVCLGLIGTATHATAQITIGATDYGTDLELAVDAAVDGDVVNVPDGTYVITNTLNIDVGLTLQGQSEPGTIVQIDVDGPAWGVKLSADDITIQDISFESITSTANSGYILHGEGIENLPGGWNNLTIRRTTIFGDATTGPSRRGGFDIHGFNNVLLEDIESRDASAGNGVQVTGCIGVDMNGVTTSNNAWGSVAVYVSGPTYMNRASDDVVIDGTSSSFAESAVYSQGAGGVPNTNVSVTGWDYVLRNPAAAPEYEFFVDTRANAVLGALGFTGAESSSTVERVTDGFFVVDPGMSIQAAIDAAPVAGTVEVAAGAYEEQISIGKDVSVLGAGIGQTILESPVTLVSTFSRGSTDFHPVVTIDGGTAGLLQGFTVDGLGRGAANRDFVGIGFYNAGGTVDACRVTAIREDPLNGNQHGLGIYGIFDDVGSHAAAVTNSQVDDFQKNGITFNAYGGTTLDVTIDNNTVTGAGVLVLGDPAQNGIQTQGVATTAQITNNVISGINYDNTGNPTPYVASSVLGYGGDVLLEGNVIGPAQAGAYLIEGNFDVRDNDVTVELVGVESLGIIVADPDNAVPQGYAFADASGNPLGRRAGTFDVVIEDNTVLQTGGSPTSTFGVVSYMGYFELFGDGPEVNNLTMTGNTVSGFDTGVTLLECDSGCTGSTYGSIAINQNDFSGNTFGLFSNATSATVDASCNWWGDVSGPLEGTINPIGTGSEVDGDVTFQPWLDAVGGTCSLLANSADVGPPPSELNDCTDCIDVPVSLSRANADAARGVSVTFELSAELELCGTPTVSSGSGAFYDGFVGDVQDFFLDNGDGTYTFDTAILGTNCGPTGGGEVFTIPVSFVAGLGSDTTGTIDVTAVTFRGCANVPLPLLPGAGTTLEIDVTAPGAVSDLTAVQVKSGNDGNGTTKIDLSWTLPADGDLTGVQVFRKGFGDYPEYDDLAGAVPSTPADPAAAITDGWTPVTGTPLAPTATSYTDEPSTRDFWYYVAFVTDECYTSAVSGQTDGTLNYHLGDVAPPPNGNNQVATGDISFLGAAYGTVDGDANYQPTADVGPTTDFSVDARPTTDNAIQFEDLIVFAINYGVVGKHAPVPAAVANALELTLPATLDAGSEITVPVALRADGSLQGLSVELEWNGNVLEYRGWTAGDVMNAQTRPAPVFSPRPGVIDTAVLGTASQGIAGEGTLAFLRFAVKGDGDPGLRFASIDARDASNEAVSLDGTVVQGVSGTPSVITRSALRANVPNPFNPSTTIFFAVAERGPVSVRIYDLKGRLVRQLVDETHDAGEHEVQWNGTDDGGRTVASGTYLLRLDASDRSDARRIMLVK